MYWNDPTLYGATLPQREIPIQATPWFSQWQNVPRMMPTVPFGQPFGQTMPQQFAPPMVPPVPFNVPFNFNIPQMGYNAFPFHQFQTFLPNTYLPNLYRPFWA